MFSFRNSAAAAITLSLTEFATAMPSIFCPVKQAWVIHRIFNPWNVNYLPYRTFIDEYR